MNKKGAAAVVGGGVVGATHRAGLPFLFTRRLTTDAPPPSFRTEAGTQAAGFFLSRVQPPRPALGCSRMLG